MANGKSKTGVKDVSTKSDLFKITSYIQGLTNFISECNTPMTVAVQGDWGSGKTSIMEMVQANLKNSKSIIININTWQYSQFEFDTKLSIFFLQSLIEQLSRDTTGKMITSIKQVASEITTSLTILGAGVIGGANASRLTENVINNMRDSSAVQVINNLKSQFEVIISERCKKENKDRVIFFIDDLDRLQPEKAVELMEVLKIFLECENCVFVLAIDYEVVSQGVKTKYKGMDDTKARRFFDKIIQVPFTMPVGRYDINNYIGELLKESGMKDTFDSMKNNQGEIQDIYIDLVRYTVGTNPRSIKRLINTYSLLVSISSIQTDKQNKQRFLSVLFATICGQVSYEKMYNFLLELSTSKELLREFLTNLTENNSSWFKEQGEIIDKLGLSNASDLEIDQIISYIDKLLEIVNDQFADDVNKEVEAGFQISDDAIQLLCETLLMSATTATSSNLDHAVPGFFDEKIKDIYSVVEKVGEQLKSDSYEFKSNAVTSSIKKTAESKGVTESTIASKCYRGLSCNAKEFVELCKDFYSGNPDRLISKIIERNKNKRITSDSINELFMKAIFKYSKT